MGDYIGKQLQKTKKKENYRRLLMILLDSLDANTDYSFDVVGNLLNAVQMISAVAFF